MAEVEEEKAVKQNGSSNKHGSKSPSNSKSRSRSKSRSHSKHSKSVSRSASKSRTPTRKKSKKSRKKSSRRRRSRSSSYSSRSRSRSRGRRSYSRSYSNSRSRTRSRSFGRSYRRGSSHFIQRGRRFNVQERENPPVSKVLGCFGLSPNTTDRDLESIFQKFGDIEKVMLIIDRKTGISKGYGFIYYKDVKSAINAKDSCSGMELDGRVIRVDFSLTRQAHDPTPGRYFGKITRGGMRGGGFRGYRGRRGGRFSRNSYSSRPYHGYDRYQSYSRSPSRSNSRRRSRS